MASSWASRSFVEVLPDEPVTPTTVTSGSRRSTAAASAARAAKPSRDLDAGPSTGRVTRLATAPAAVGGGDVVVAVDALAGQGEEQPARRDLARVELDACR